MNGMPTKKIEELVALMDEMEKCGCGGACETCQKSQEAFEKLTEEEHEEIDQILGDESTRNTYLGV